MFYVSCFVNCHNSVMGVVVVVVSKNYLLNDHTRTNIFNIHNNHYIIVQGHRGDQGGGISFFISYISLGVCARVQLNTFHILSINNANTCGGTVDTHSPILPRNLHYTYHTLSCSLLLNSDLFHAHVCIYLAYIYQGC